MCSMTPHKRYLKSISKGHTCEASRLKCSGNFTKLLFKAIFPWLSYASRLKWITSVLGGLKSCLLLLISTFIRFSECVDRLLVSTLKSLNCLTNYSSSTSDVLQTLKKKSSAALMSSYSLSSKELSIHHFSGFYDKFVSSQCRSRYSLSEHLMQLQPSTDSGLKLCFSRSSRS